MLIDSHAHVNFKEYVNNLEDVILRSLNSNTQIITVGSNFQASQKAIEIAEKYPVGIWAVIGLHPLDATKDFSETITVDGQEQVLQYKKEEFNYDRYKLLAESSKKVVGLGETGLDYFRVADANTSLADIKIKQTEIFKQFIKLSRELNLPLVMHCRGEETAPLEAYDQMLKILETEIKENGELKGVIHCFGGSLDQAQKFIELGFYVGFTGIVTFSNAKNLQDVAMRVPLEKILIETDAPFLAPEPHRGKMNEPAFVTHIAQKIAELKRVSFDEVEKQTYENTVKLFKL